MTESGQRKKLTLLSSAAQGEDLTMIEDRDIVFWNLLTMIVSDQTAWERYSLPKEHIATITRRF